MQQGGLRRGRDNDRQLAVVHNASPMHVSARSDYAVRALVELAAAAPRPIKRQQIGSAQDIPVKFLGNILHELKMAGLVTAHRGTDSGYSLARPATSISLAEVMRVIDGPLAHVRGDRPETLHYVGAATPLRDVWLAVRASLRSVLEHVTLADVAGDTLPPDVKELAGVPVARPPSRRRPATSRKLAPAASNPGEG
jgi:Rrf2 family protein